MPQSHLERLDNSIKYGKYIDNTITYKPIQSRSLNPNLSLTTTNTQLVHKQTPPKSKTQNQIALALIQYKT